MPRRTVNLKEREWYGIDWYLDQLDGVEVVRKGRKWKAYCPCHDDVGSEQKGLSIDLKADGTILMKCHSPQCGAQLPEVHETLDGTGSSPDPTYEASYTYKTRSGKTYTKHRRGRGKGKAFHWTPTFREGEEVELRPYHDDKLARAIKRGQRVLVVEGEEDVHAAEAEGEVATTSGTEWDKAHAEYLRGADVLIVRDRDRAGRTKTQRLRRLLVGVAASVRVCDPRTGDEDSGDDLSDHLAAGFSIDDLEPADRFTRVDLGALIEGGIPTPELIVEDVLYAGRAHALMGEPGDGKTLVALAYAVELMRAGRNVAWFDEENGPSVIAARLVALGASAELVSKHFFYFPFTEPTLDDAPELVDEVVALDPDLVVFDSGADMYAASDLNENDNMDMTRWAREFSQRLSREHGIATLILEHVAKSGDSSYQRGAGAKKAKVDVSWKLEVEAPFDHETVGEVELERKKDRLAHLPPLLRYRIGGNGTGTTVFERLEVEDEEQQKVVQTRQKVEAFRSEAIDMLRKNDARSRETGLSQRQLTELLSPAEQRFKNEVVQTLAKDPTTPVHNARGARNSIVYWVNEVEDDD